MVFGKKSSENQLTTLRKEHIDHLRKIKYVKEIQQETEFVVPLLQVPAITANIRLGPDFPKSAPTIRISPDVEHPIVNSRNMSLLHPKLESWQPQNSLDKIIEHTISQFKTNPPKILQNHNSIYNNTGQSFQTNTYPSNPYPSIYQPAMTTAAPTHSTSYPSVTTPTYPSMANYPPNTKAQQEPKIHPLLVSKTQQELSSLNNDVQKLQQFFESTDDYKKKEEELKIKRIQYEKELESLVDLEPELNDCHEKLSQTVREVEDLKKVNEQYQLILPQLAEVVDSKNLLTKLRQLKTSSEEESENIAWNYLNGSDMDVDQFKELFINKRKLFHQREAKLEIIKANPQILTV